jgi:hypothetical protein
MAHSQTIIVGGGIAATLPFTVGAIPFIVAVTPPAISASPIMAQVTGANQAIIISPTGADPFPTATELLRVRGGAIIEGTVANTLVIGRGAVANAGNNVALGTGASATSSTCVAVGSTAAASGNNSIAVGAGAIANGGGGGGGAIAIGNAASATGAAGSVAIGVGAVALAGSVAIGNTCDANLSGALAIGNSCGTNNTASTAMGGFNCRTAATGQILIGAGASPSSIGAAAGASIAIGATVVIGAFTDNILIGAGLTAFQANCCMLGGPSTLIANLVLGQGNTAAGQTPVLIRLTDRTGAGNLAGSDLTIRSGAGVGTNVGNGTIFLQTPIAAAGGVTQGFVTRITITGGGVIFAAPDIAQPNITLTGFGGAGQSALAMTNLTNGAAANAATLLNAPAAGDPAFWVPIRINGVNRHVPVW